MDKQLIKAIDMEFEIYPEAFGGPVSIEEISNIALKE